MPRRLLLLLLLSSLAPGCKRAAGPPPRDQARERSLQTAAFQQLIGRLEGLARRGQSVAAACAALQPQLAPLRVDTDAAARKVLVRYHALCSALRSRPR